MIATLLNGNSAPPPNAPNAKAEAEAFPVVNVEVNDGLKEEPEANADALPELPEERLEDEAEENELASAEVTATDASKRAAIRRR